MKTARSVCILVLFLTACSDNSVTYPLVDLPPSAAIVDGAAEGNSHFFFLPPMVKAPSYSGTFDGSLSPVVRITGDDGFLAELGTEVNEEEESYQLNWHTGRFNLTPETAYRIAVLVEGQELGSADVVVADKGNQSRQYRTQPVVVVKNGRTLPIKFRIEEGALNLAVFFEPFEVDRGIWTVHDPWDHVTLDFHETESLLLEKLRGPEPAYVVTEFGPINNFVMDFQITQTDRAGFSGWVIATGIGSNEGWLDEVTDGFFMILNPPTGTICLGVRSNGKWLHRPCGPYQPGPHLMFHGSMHDGLTAYIRIVRVGKRIGYFRSDVPFPQGNGVAQMMDCLANGPTNGFRCQKDYRIGEMDVDLSHIFALTSIAMQGGRTWGWIDDIRVEILPD